MEGTGFEPTLLSRSNDIRGEENFTRGCEISPDGLCILTCTASDNRLRLYNTPTPSIVTDTVQLDGIDAQQSESTATCNSCETENKLKLEQDVNSWKTVLSAKGGDSVRTYSWYPLMDSYQPASCAFIASCRYVTVCYYLLSANLCGIFI